MFFVFGKKITGSRQVAALDYTVIKLSAATRLSCLVVVRLTAAVNTTVTTNYTCLSCDFAAHFSASHAKSEYVSWIYMTTLTIFITIQNCMRQIHVSFTHCVALTHSGHWHYTVPVIRFEDFRGSQFVHG